MTTWSDKPNRLLITFVVVVAVALVGGGAAFSVMTAPVEADASVNDFSVPDESVEAEEINNVGFFWAGGISWSDTPEPVETVDIAVYAEDPDGNMQELLSFTCSHEDPPDECGFDSSTEGSNYMELEVGLIMHGDWTSDHFSPDPGEEESHTIKVMAETEVNWDGGSTTESATDTTTLTVTHPDDGEEADPSAVIELGAATVTLS